MYASVLILVLTTSNYLFFIFSQFYQIHQYTVRIVQFETALVMISDSPGNHEGLAMPRRTYLGRNAL